MGRAEIRRQEREARQNEVKYTFTKGQLNTMIKAEVKKQLQIYIDETDKKSMEWKKVACEAAFNNFVSAGMYVLHNKFGFGKKRLSEYIDRVQETLTDITDGRISIDDICMVLQEECKMQIVRDIGVEKLNNERGEQ